MKPETILGLSYISVFPVIATVILYLLDKKTAFGKLGNKTKQLIYGLVFGGLAVIGTEFGVNVGVASANTRDAAVLTAGLVFGSPAGIIAGVIGGVERFFAAYWGRGTYTQIACSLSTLLAGFFGAVLRKYMFDNKKPSVSYALTIGLVTEVFHMLMIFITNMADISTGFVLIQACAIPMITVNGLSVMLSVLIVTLLGKEKSKHRFRDKQISTLAQRWLLSCVVAAFLITCIFTSLLQFRISDENIDELLSLNIEDVVTDVKNASDRNLLNIAYKVRAELENNDDINAIADAYNIAEINVVDENGIITASTNPEYLHFDMGKNGEQAAAFLVLLHGEEAYVQEKQPISFDNSVSRKYAGVALTAGGFIQVGYDVDNIKEDIGNEMVNAVVNRHIEKSGYFFIADKEHNVISAGQDKLGRISFSELELEPLTETDTRFRARLDGEDVFCMYNMCEDYYVVGVLPENEATFTRNLSIYMMAFMEIVIFGALFILTYFLIKKLVVDNIKSVNNSLAEITNGNLNVTVNVRSNDEFASLSDDINATVDTLKQYIAEAAARIDKELELAKVIQESSLPSVFPPFPNKKELDIYATMDAAKEVGGDFYDFYLLDDDHLAFLVADVSGKGITGAMFMMKAKTLIKSFAEHSNDAAEILTKTNNALCDGNDAEMFVTCFFGIIDMKNGTLRFSNAGHNPPLICRKDGSFAYYKTRPGFVLGGMENIKYRNEETEFNMGDTIFLYTDGVTEATNADEKLYGDERLCNILNDTAAKTAADICRAVKADVDEFVGEAPQFDDITMLCVVTHNTEKNSEREDNE